MPNTKALKAIPGVSVLVRNGFATISAPDSHARGQVLNRLLERTPAPLIEKLTRSGPHPLYRVPEDSAREARLITKANTVDVLPDRVDSRFADDFARTVDPALKGPRPAQPRPAP
ncbi:hypothetical protein [Mycobacterium vicinigordonae]|uniref:Uncharacterized protein n=1 Tax=Mycobacterium vicinigordonae TaxID=1719132 RepID=A0A7D6I340_9MYCO|nr:hypothetical protein [Mycobacterium vicinigordonae]QLL08854.1 hypothetical protein H0P51_08105 [Mycobacterium vicinigordonae]